MLQNLICIWLVLVCSSLCSQTPHALLQCSNKSSTPHSFFANRSEWIEQTDARSEHQTLWKHADGRVMIESAHRPIHFMRNGSWQRISAACKITPSGWIADDQPHAIAVGRNGAITTDANGASALRQKDNCTFNGQALRFEMQAQNATHFIGVDHQSLLSKSIEVFENAAKYSYTLEHAPQERKGHSILTEVFQANDSIHIITHANEGKRDGELWFGPIHIINASGQQIAVMQPVTCFDGNESWQQSGERICAGYSWEIAGNEMQLSTHIPNSWLTATNRTYPITIDPLITGPTALFGDNVMLSCFIPQFNVDSLLVTIPAQVSITACYVTASFYADPLALAMMGDGVMFFSTNCDSTEYFEVAAPNDVLAGTAYLENFDFRDPLMCCFAPSCQESTLALRMHLGRYYPDGDCNYASIYYSPATTLWPFSAFIEGHTVETYSLEWTVANAAICSSQCTFEGRVRMKYGVPPYTITHSWMNGSVIVEEPTPCDLAGKYADIPMEWPGCPQFCPEPFSVPVPPPVVTDACGNTITGLSDETLNIKAAPSIEDPSPVQVCSNILENITFQTCAPDYTLSWTGNGTSGEGYSLPVLLTNNDTVISTASYFVNTNWNGCPSDTLEVIVQTLPSPHAEFSIAPNPAMQNIPAFFINESTLPIGTINSWWWTLDGEQPQYGDITDYAIPDLGYHTVCLEVTSETGCPDTICKNFEVVTPHLTATNVFTPNGDDDNATLVFDQLEFFPSNTLHVWNRWGVLVYEQENYQNNWDGDDLPEGTYYYVLDVDFYGKLASYFEILR
jgi:gliding motility-associated-like protein